MQNLPRFMLFGLISLFAQGCFAFAIANLSTTCKVHFRVDADLDHRDCSVLDVAKTADIDINDSEPHKIEIKDKYAKNSEFCLKVSLQSTDTTTCQVPSSPIPIMRIQATDKCIITVTSDNDVTKNDPCIPPKLSLKNEKKDAKKNTVKNK